MRPARFGNRRIAVPRHQQGVVLLIALIILVAMTLAGIGMMRSVDTGSVIAGNMAFREATMNASDAGTNAGFNALMQVANYTTNGADKLILNFNNGQPCSNAAGATNAYVGCNVAAANINFPGYYASCAGGLAGQANCLYATSSTWWTIDANWANASPPVTITDPTTNQPIATVQYYIHRMCQLAGSGPNDAGQQCQTYPPTGIMGTSPGGTKSSGLNALISSVSVFYRITSRSVGTRNTVSYAQTLVLIAE